MAVRLYHFKVVAVGDKAVFGQYRRATGHPADVEGIEGDPSVDGKGLARVLSDGIAERLRIRIEIEVFISACRGVS